MVGFKHTLCALLLTMVTGTAIAQNNTNSPYTRYGYGDLSDQSFGNSRAMGGIAFGLRDGAQINPLNPASYTAIDSLTFLFEGGVSLQNMNISGSGVKLNAKNSSFDYLAMQFRLHPRIAMSIGLLPFSNVGYSVSDTQAATDPTTGNTADYARSYTGDGGLHNHQSVASVSSYKLDFGAQYTFDINKKHSVTIGAIYSPKLKLGNDYSVTTQMVSNSTGTAVSTTTLKPDATFEVPNTFGAGFTYNYDKRLTVGLDYSLQQWSKTKFDVNTSDEAVREDFNETYTYCDRHKISVGAEYIPNLMGRSYLSHIKYRLGAYYTTPYYKIGGKEATREYGVTAGFGLPVPRSRSILSISGQFVRISGQESAFVNENIFRVSIGLTFNERWFFKRRVE